MWATSSMRSECSRCTGSARLYQRGFRWSIPDAAKYSGTAKDCVVWETVPGGHIGLFMGARTPKELCPPLAGWIAARQPLL
jgi:hypothetical protein